MATMGASVFQTAAKSLVLNETSQRSAVAVEEAESRRIAAARERKEQRRQRFLNARERTIGVRSRRACSCLFALIICGCRMQIDVDYIAKQQEERKAAAAREKEEEYRYGRNLAVQSPPLRGCLSDQMCTLFNPAQEQLSIDRALERFELQLKAERQAKLEQAKQEWKRQLAMKKFNPDFALNDKSALRNEVPARVGDNDPRLGPASMQVFDGEDLREAERRELQHRQMKNWCIEENMKKRIKRIKELEDEL